MTDYTNQDVHRKLQNLQQTDCVSEQNAELLEEFVQELQAREETSASRICWYISKFSTLLKRYINTDKNEDLSTDSLDELTKTDMVKLIGELKNDGKKDYSEKTINGFKTSLKMFYKLRHPLQYQRPDRVKRILQSGVLKSESDPERKTKVNLLTPEQVWKMVEEAINPRDKLIPILLLDAGARTKEVRKVKISDIEQHSEYWEVTFMDAKNGKDDRPLQLTHCIQQLRTWLENHPRKGDSEAPLLVNLSNKGDGNRGKELSSKNLNEILKRLARRADLEGIDADTLSVYDFRHSSATFRGTEKNWGIQRMLFWYAWKKPDRAKTYCHENEKRMRKAILADKGITPEEEDGEGTMQMKKCPRCEKERSTGADYCPRCSLPLDTKKAMKDSKLKRAGQFLVEMKLDEEVTDKELKQKVEQVQNHFGGGE